MAPLLCCGTGKMGRKEEQPRGDDGGNSGSRAEEESEGNGSERESVEGWRPVLRESGRRCRRRCRRSMSSVAAAAVQSGGVRSPHKGRGRGQDQQSRGQGGQTRGTGTGTPSPAVDAADATAGCPRVHVPDVARRTAPTIGSRKPAEADGSAEGRAVRKVARSKASPVR